MLVGYMRVSKNDGSQSFDLQRDALIAAGVEKERLYQDKVSGKKEERPGLQACLKALQPGNTLMVWKLDRLGRDLKHLVTVVDELRQRNVGFKVLTGQGAQIDTTTPHGRLVFNLFAALAEFERELIIERTQAGLSSARARGRLGGRPRKMDGATLRIAMAAMANPQTIASQVAKRLKITTATLYTYVNSDGSLKEAGKKVLLQR
ncbi:MAG: recombinase family protein [Gammaproteobacteria bacterium]|nr:recombinase family protein [Gammaproteobacteria bacterium]